MKSPIIEIGFCQCGCGQRTKIASRSDTKSGHIKNKHFRFAKGHHFHNGQSLNDYLRIPGKKGYIREHIVRAEKAFGGPLPEKAEVHHANGEKHGGPLIICQDRAYHMLLHQRQRALNACGHANWRKCLICKQYDAPENLKIYRDGRAYHGHCKCAYETVGRNRRKSFKPIN